MIKARHKHGIYVRLTLEDGTRILEHRHVMENRLGRKLETWEHVHHKDGDGNNNCVSNLEVVTNSQHGKEHARERTEEASVELVCPTCGKTFVRLESYIKSKAKQGSKLYCSRLCVGSCPTLARQGRLDEYLQVIEDNPGISINGAAKLMGVNRSSILYWKRKIKGVEHGSYTEAV